MTIAYRDACGPRALSALTGMDAHDIAGQLGALARARGNVLVPATSDDVLDLWLVRRGFAVEPWNVMTDAALLPAHEHAERLRTQPPRPVDHDARLLVERVAEARPDLPREAIEAAAAKIPTLAEWVDAHPVGAWVVCVNQHVLVFEAGKVLAGDHDDLRLFGAERVERAARVTRT